MTEMIGLKNIEISASVKAGCIVNDTVICLKKRAHTVIYI